MYIIILLLLTFVVRRSGKPRSLFLFLLKTGIRTNLRYHTNTYTTTRQWKFNVTVLHAARASAAVVVTVAAADVEDDDSFAKTEDFLRS